MIFGENYPAAGLLIGLAVKQSPGMNPNEASYYDDFGGLVPGSAPTNQWQDIPWGMIGALTDAAVAYEFDRQDITSRTALNAGKLQKTDTNANPSWEGTSLPRGAHNIAITAVDGDYISFQPIRKFGESSIYYSQPGAATYRFKAGAMRSASDTASILQTARECKQSGTGMHLTMTARGKVDNLARGEAESALRRTSRTLSTLSNARGEGSGAAAGRGGGTAENSRHNRR